MGKDHKPKEIPADKLAENMPPIQETSIQKTSREFWKAFRENNDEVAQERVKMEREDNRKIWNWYRKTPVGKLWVKLRNHLKKTKSGRIGLVGIYLGMFVVLMFTPTLAGMGIDLFFGAQVGHTNLTQDQVDEGYVEPCLGNRSCSPTGAAYRMMSKSEKAGNPECPANADECISVITLQEECISVTTEIFEYAKKGDWFEANTIFLEKYPQVGKNFEVGTKFVFPITGLNPKYEDWAIDHVRCDY